MMAKQLLRIAILPSVLAVLAAGAFGAWHWSGHRSKRTSAHLEGAAPPSALVQNEQPVAPEKNPLGDIPDSQVFVKYSSAGGGYELQVPEGWARTAGATDVRFADKFDGLKVEITNASVAPSVENVRKHQLQALLKQERAVKVTHIGAGEQPNGAAVVVSYESNSAPDPVTGKQIRLENERFFYYRHGRLAALTLWAPLGADNVDQWRLISNSFRWR